MTPLGVADPRTHTTGRRYAIPAPGEYVAAPRMGDMAERWEGRRRAEALKRVKAKGARSRTPCVICGDAIDYRLTYPDPWSCSVQHVKSKKNHPELIWDPSNWAPAHLYCNKVDQAGEALDLGVADGW